MYKSNINLNLYKTFYEVSKYGSITETAKKTYSSQPAISKAIKRLEEDLDVQLFYRNLNGVKLTNKGKELLSYVEKAYNNLVVAERSMIETENLERGKLSIGMPSNIGSFFLFDKIIEFHNKYKNIEFTIITGSTHSLLNLLENHTIDFIIDTSPIITNDANTIVKPLTTAKYCFVSNKDFKNKDNIKKLKDLENEQLILPIPKTANRNDLDDILKVNNVKIENVLNIHTSEMIISAVKKNLGIGYVIENLVEGDQDLEILNINENLPSVTINLVYNKNYLTTAPKKFIKAYIDDNLSL